MQRVSPDGFSLRVVLLSRNEDLVGVYVIWVVSGAGDHGEPDEFSRLILYVGRERSLPISRPEIRQQQSQPALYNEHLKSYSTKQLYTRKSNCSKKTI